MCFLDLQNIVWNIVMYYKQFLSAILRSKEEKKSHLEKELKVILLSACPMFDSIFKKLANQFSSLEFYLPFCNRRVTHYVDFGCKITEKQDWFIFIVER